MTSKTTTTSTGTKPAAGSAQQAAPAAKAERSGKAPTHAAYHVRDREGKKGIWTRIGSAWPHADGQGLSLQLDCVPLDGRVSLRVITDKPE